MALVLLLALLLSILGIASRPLWYDEAFSVLFAEKGIKAMLAGTLAVQTGGAGIGYSQHAGQVIVADGTSEAAVRLERVLTTDPGMGVVRHADAGYQEAIQAARRHGIKMPMLK